MTVKQKLVSYTPPQVMHWAKYLCDARYRHKSRHLARLKSLPRYHPASTRLLGKPLQLVDSASFISMYQEIFERQIYRFSSAAERPYIIDCGANIGLSVLYFKQLYPRSRIVAFEPDEAVFQALVTNIRTHGCEDVELLQRAVWSSETTLNFAVEGADAGHLCRDGEDGNKVVRTIRLRDYLSAPVNLLKMDIEGAETEVLEDCADRLGQVENLFVEYHSLAKEPQTFHRLMQVLAGASFRIHLHPESISAQPFIERTIDAGMDMRLNIFAFRPAAGVGRAKGLFSA